MTWNVEPACASFWCTVIKPLSNWITDNGTPVYLLPLSHDSTRLAITVVDSFEFLGVPPRLPAMPDDSPIVRIGYLGCPPKGGAYLQALSIPGLIEGRWYWDSSKLVFKTLARIRWETEESKRIRASGVATSDGIPF